MKLNDNFFNQLLLEADKSVRKRAHYNLHKTFDEPVQRLCIALNKGTYVRPHHHSQENKWELIICLKGSVGLVVFDKHGVVVDKDILVPGDSVSGIELVPNTWHAVYPMTEQAVIIEIKEGPYASAKESDFAQWAPKEGEPEVQQFLSWLESSAVDDRYES